MSSTICLCHLKPNSKVRCESSMTRHVVSFSVGTIDVRFLTLPTGVGDKVTKDIRPGVPFEPTYIYKLLTLIKSSLSEKVSYVVLHFHVKAVCQGDAFFLMITL